MKLFFDFLPIIVFFAAYYLGDIYIATGAAIAASIIQVVYLYARGHKPEFMNWMALGMIVVLGSATLLFKNEMFIKWKPTGVYWLLSLVFLSSQLFAKQPLVKTMLQNSVEIPEKKWGILNLSWVLFFLVMGALNLFVVYNFSTEIWVNFKLFGSLGLTFLFVIGQGFYLMKYMPQENGNESK